MRSRSRRCVASTIIASPRSSKRSTRAGPNPHIGVVTSDMGTSSSQHPPGPTVGTVGSGGCAGTGDDGVLRRLANGAAFISDVALPGGSRDRNYTGALRDVFAEVATVGVG